MNTKATARAALLRSSSVAATRVFTTILTRSPISRTDVARLTGLSQAAVTKAVTPMVAAGLLDDTLDSHRIGVPGRPASPVAVVADALIVIGIKVNPNELIGVACDLTTTVVASKRRSLPSTRPSTVINAIVKLVHALEEDLAGRGGRLAAIGVSVSGDVDTATGVVRESAYMDWTDVRLQAELASRLEDHVVVIGTTCEP
jgi:hypothetical protein